jgi:hypothetical protein
MSSAKATDGGETAINVADREVVVSLLVNVAAPLRTCRHDREVQSTNMWDVVLASKPRVGER